MKEYSGTSEQRTRWDQYKFKWFVPCIEVVLFKRFQSHYIDRGDKIGDLVSSIVERYLIQCPFLGGSFLRAVDILQCWRKLTLAGFHTGFFVRGGRNILVRYHIGGGGGGHQACPTEITSEIQKVTNKLVVNKFQPSKC